MQNYLEYLTASNYTEENTIIKYGAYQRKIFFNINLH